MVTKSTRSGSDSTYRAFVSSITTTRGSLRSFQCEGCPCPRQWRRLCRAAPGRQSVDPLVDAPTSAQASPFTSSLNALQCRVKFFRRRVRRSADGVTVTVDSLSTDAPDFNATPVRHAHLSRHDKGLRLRARFSESALDE
ncbi:MAG: hypothetical protein U0X93_18655 [Anaerolineales bacterium]